MQQDWGFAGDGFDVPSEIAHRAVDGAYSAAYLRTLKGMIEARDWEAALHA